ncbi:hypothetical protein ARAF_0475 [Arsenophonus endosymbiont of Aleurodicus floccissimus]|uniref:hypothetical protein n=1 Tax=Arsenophonus endosymbiont of Aleurodicus floccissimus TaxID=2152761 RepID=UPI000ED63E6D|nr:hypothetical protein [Arsenophonus endosymbiont of Aleurodicus floccissimus]SPP31351.1 hypothetical protein ARAF_0475 [Arsenophonus endosymbiont of Aleurodicus floccissimus]
MGVNPDPRKIAALPTEILTHWQAFFLLESEPEGADKAGNEVIAHDDVNQQCNTIMRILNG